MYSHMARNMSTHAFKVDSQGLHVLIMDHSRSALAKASLEAADRLSTPPVSLSYMPDCTNKENLLDDSLMGRVGSALAKATNPFNSN